MLSKAILTIAACCPSWFHGMRMTEYCASRRVFSWGFKLYLVCAGDVMPIPPTTTSNLRGFNHLVERDMNDLLDLVRGTMARILELTPEEVDVDLGFFDLGMDSAMATEFVRLLESAVGRSLPTTVLFDHPTARGLAAYLSAIVQPVAAQAMAGDEAEEGLLRDLRREIAAARAMRKEGGIE